MSERTTARLATRRRSTHIERAWPVAVSAFTIAFLVAGSLGTSTGRQAGLAGVLAIEMLTPSSLQPLRLVTPEPVVENVRVDAGDRGFRAVVYRPGGGGTHGALVFAMGLKAWPLDDPRLERFASSLARAGIVVMAIDSPGLRFDQVRPRDVDDLVVAFDYLRRQPDVDPARAGFLGVSTGGSLALVAAADPRIAARVAFVDTIGAYYDVRSSVRAVSVGDVDGWRPGESSAALVRKQVIDYATEGEDRVLLNDRFYLGRDTGDALAQRLTPRGRAVLALLENHEPSHFDALYTVTGLDSNRDFAYLSPSRSLDRVTAEVRILHSRRDDHIPFSEAEALLAASRLNGRGSFQAFDAFDHVDPSRSAEGPALAADGVRLYAYLLGLLQRLR